MAHFRQNLNPFLPFTFQSYLFLQIVSNYVHLGSSNALVKVIVERNSLFLRANLGAEFVCHWRRTSSEGSNIQGPDLSTAYHSLKLSNTKDNISWCRGEIWILPFIVTYQTLLPTKRPFFFCPQSHLPQCWFLAAEITYQCALLEVCNSLFRIEPLGRFAHTYRADFMFESYPV